MTDLAAQKQIGHIASMAAHNRLRRTEKYLALIDAAIERARGLSDEDRYVRDKQQARRVAQHY